MSVSVPKVTSKTGVCVNGMIFEIHIPTFCRICFVENVEKLARCW